MAMTRDIKKIVSQMTLEEKAGLCSGFDSFRTKAVERLNIPSITMVDGPNGVRKENSASGKSGIHATVPATCFPPASLSACSWDRCLLYEVGVALGEECQSENIDVLLGPSVNIKRSPLCGRNFEYFSEDPLLASELAAGLVKGVQSQGVGTSVKHFALNNQESRRMTVSADVDERTLREIYLAVFEKIVKKAQPWTIMCAYNKVNGCLCSENQFILSDILRNEWHYEGFVLSDWGATHDRVKGLTAGLELEMPASGGVNDQKIVDAVKKGFLPEEILDDAVIRLLNIVFRVADNKREKKGYNQVIHHGLARKVAAESIVLLKNYNHVLPLKKTGSLAVIGAFARFPRFQGDGSSYVNAAMTDDILDRISASAQNGVKITYADGYRMDSDEIDESLMEEAESIAQNADSTVIFAGLPDRYECEGQDRANMDMPENHIKLIEALSKVTDNLVVVLCNGVPVEMPWVDKVGGIIEAYLGGQGFGGAIADILFGNQNPCGKLAESFPKKMRDTPAYLSFPGTGDHSEYREGVFVGYRYYDKKGIEPLFPFGYGLSYTKFDYEEMNVDKKTLTDTDVLNVTVTVRNSGNTAGKEIVELYVRDIESSIARPDKELREFEKIELQPGESKTIHFNLDKRDFSFFDIDSGDWFSETGEFEILIGKSSRDIVRKQSVYFKSSTICKHKFNRDTLLGELIRSKRCIPAIEELVTLLCADGMELNHLKDCPAMLNSVIDNLPLRTAVAFSGGVFTEDNVDSLLEILNA